MLVIALGTSVCALLKMENYLQRVEVVVFSNESDRGIPVRLLKQTLEEPFKAGRLDIVRIIVAHRIVVSMSQQTRSLERRLTGGPDARRSD